MSSRNHSPSERPRRVGLVKLSIPAQSSVEREVIRRMSVRACADMPRRDGRWPKEETMIKFAAGALALAFVFSAGFAAAQSNPPLKLGLILDMSGPYADITGPGSVVAGKMAAEDFGGEVLGRKIEILSADHLNKADVAGTIAREWFDNQGAEAIMEVAASGAALAV